MPVGSVLRRATGIVGLRLFPNPDFDEARRASTGIPERYYTDPELLQSQGPGAAVPRRHVVRLLPRRPEPDQAAGRSGEPEVGEPELERRRAVLLGRPHLQLERRRRPNFVYQLFHTSRPGSLDTSLVSTDNINNPRTMNAVY